MGMKLTSVVVAAVVVMGFCGVAESQIVTFNHPMEWLTQRDGAVVAKTLFDTTRINKKRVKMSLALYQNGQKKNIGSKTVKVTDFTAETELGAMPGKLLGGMDYAVVEWTVVETKEKGSIGPVGLVALPKLGAAQEIGAKKTSGKPSLDNAEKLVGENGLVPVGSHKAGYLWDQVNWYIVLVKDAPIPEGGVTFACDGKNAKSAFVAYADRFVTVLPGDSVVYTHYKRSFRKDSISYVAAKWDHEAEVVSNERLVLITMPWHDMGMVKPFVGRRFGFAAMVRDGDDKTTASVPTGAEYFLPGSWADMVCGE